MITRFMQVMFSAAENNDEELTSQVANDIETAKDHNPGSGIEDDEVSYVNLGSGKVLITDKGTGEATVAEQNEDDPDQYDLEGFESDEELEKYLHTLDGIDPDENIHDLVTEDFQDHMTGEDYISPNLSDGGLNPDAGYEPSVTEYTPEDDEEEKTYSVTMNGEELALFSDYLYENANTASLKIFSEPKFYGKIFSDVLTKERPAIVGGLKVEKVDDDTIIITDIESGDEVQVVVDEDGEFIVSEVQKELSEEKTYSDLLEYLYSEDSDEDDDEEDSDEDDDEEDSDEDDDEEDSDEDDDEEDSDEDDEKEDSDEDDDEEDSDEDDEKEKTYSALLEYLYSDDEDDDEEGDEYEPLFVVGIDPVNHVVVDSPVYCQDDAEALSQHLAELGVEEVEIFDDPDEARDHATNLLSEEGVTDVEQLDEPEEHNFSDVTVFTTRYFSDCTEFMFKLFSESEDNITDTQDDIEDAIESGEVTETEDEIITPIDDNIAVVQDKNTDEYTMVTLDDDDVNTQKITEEVADELIDLGDEKKDEEKKFSVVNRFFAEIEEQKEQQENPRRRQGQEVNPEEIDPETGDPIEPNQEEAPAQGVEAVEDKALAAVQSIQEAANEAVLAITEAKEAPAPGEEEDLREAQFSDFEYLDRGYNDPLRNWFENNI